MTNPPPIHLQEAPAEVLAGLALPALGDALRSYAGERCPEHETGCPVCDAWAAFDYLANLFDVPTDASQRGALCDIVATL